MNREEIANLDILLKQHIEDKKINNIKTSRLTAPGENYGGLLLRVDITLENVNGMLEELHVIAKCIPINTFMQKIFNIQVSVKKEISFYATIVPLLQEYQKEQGDENVMNFFPKLYGARLNLNGGDVVDENAAIILENLIKSGYKNVNRSVGFDMETVQLILKDLATFHAIPLALRLSKPKVFEETITPYLAEVAPSSPPPPPESEGGAQAGILEFLETHEDIHELMPTLRELLRFRPPTKEKNVRPFFTITHGDMWGNNIMIKFEKSKPVGSKFVDFQNFALRSPSRDLLFLLFSSVQKPILEQHLDDLIKFYHDGFVENLARFKCDLTAFSYEKFLEELKTESQLVLDQICFMVTFVVFGKEGGLSTDDPNKPPDFGTKEDITVQAKERVLFVIRKYKEKGWL